MESSGVALSDGTISLLIQLFSGEKCIQTLIIKGEKQK
jgi:hypothetical protein